MIAEDTDFKCEGEGEEVVKKNECPCMLWLQHFGNAIFGSFMQTLEIMMGNEATEARAGELQYAHEVEGSAKGTRDNDGKGEDG